ncbi:hypothetical protein FCU94_12660 [Vibrio sp. JPW-9-11-11]|uniref:hypothetical protein n=1 Tax=Vibrio sp. JPW-9-11-11 TaxID=1416532 RepID=UPI00159452FE|nr:hypothetical protein [Vibrio sp. JPW-9-11-11]NVD07737.1 hypothetical protein [Vibrio sp. JPW-9-11-11]
MKKPLLVATTLAFGLFVVVGQQKGLFGSHKPESFPKLPSQPDFVISHQFDGEWVGRRVDVSGNNMCERTTITGTIQDGLASLTLTYNGTSLKGWVAEEGGNLTLYATHRQWDYRFSGVANRNKIQGQWYLTNGPCKGTWYLTRVDLSS